MEEQQIDEVLLVADLQPVLASDKRKHAAHLQQEGFYFSEDRMFQLALAVFVGEFLEVESAFVLDGHFSRLRICAGSAVSKLV